MIIAHPYLNDFKIDYFEFNIQQTQNEDLKGQY